MRGKILDSYFDENTGTSYVTKHTKYGTFTEYCDCHEDDLDIMNQWDGCRFAEAKCDISALREKNKMMRQRVVGMDQIIDILDHNDDCTDNLYKQVVDLRNSVVGQIDIDFKRYCNMVTNYNEYTKNVLADRRKLRAEH